MITHDEDTDSELYRMIKNHQIRIAGNSKLKIYGSLGCASGKRMKKSNRVFFKTAREALESGFRPCGNCMRNEFLTWKNGSF